MVDTIYFDQFFVCCAVVYSKQLLLGSSYTVISYHDTNYQGWYAEFLPEIHHYYLLKKQNHLRDHLIIRLLNVC